LIVVDASALVDALVTRGPAAARIADEDLAAPHLVDAEFGNAVRRMTMSGELTAQSAQRTLDDLAGFEIMRYAQVELLSRAFELRQNASIYDALYITLAEFLDAPLVTIDRRLAGIPGTFAVVEVVPSA
jgi:predicted nucleic acid-binding protein